MTTYSYLLVLFILLDSYCSGYGYYYSSHYRKHFDPAIASFTKEPNIGSVWFTQHGNYMYLNGSVSGLPRNANLGVHIHRYGGLGNMCLEAGPHFNPFNMRHGGRFGKPRHAGDLEKLGPYDGFIGRSLVIHANDGRPRKKSR
ncbi:Extracellular superoxide dismutase [Cu-Zn] isoform 1 [Schistosoma japonicum]|uniref:Extracellular superoxide dismutase [Cu-Zn] isoform 1 n=1 Tax=Schistosoma japonicum TaxID=6182 RepID=A0A4Z2DT05_SCHJA|nr:Extracellular superoxide dismutase [Cu-Zn] isoform 1 [Schistosoma japonicum]